VPHRAVQRDTTATADKLPKTLVAAERRSRQFTASQVVTTPSCPPPFRGRNPTDKASSYPYRSLASAVLASESAISDSGY